MEKKKVQVQADTLYIPEEYQTMELGANAPQGAAGYAITTDNAYGYVLIMTQDLSKSLPREQEDLVKGIRHYLKENQGLVEVVTGDDYVYSIVKTLRDPVGVEYLMTYHKYFDDHILVAQAYFTETGMTGIRESMVGVILANKGVLKLGEPDNGWNFDPYDPDIKTGARMNLSEKREYDAMFPGFPLSECRRLIKSILEDE